MYLLPMDSRSFFSAFVASSSVSNRTKASPVALPSTYREMRTPLRPELTVAVPSNHSTYKIITESLEDDGGNIGKFGRPKFMLEKIVE